MAKTFLEFVENKENEKAVNAKVSLGDGNDFEPFVISDDPNSASYGKNKNLAPIVRAFKKGANWGWSKDDNSGEDKPVKIGAKKLFLTGGAVRDHLMGKQPRNIELATSASPDEVYNILKQNGFVFNNRNAPKSFTVEKADSGDRPFVFNVKVKNDTYELSVFKKGNKLESGTHTDDASNRDFTINSMYIQLTNDNGPNKELHDFFGGMHHLKSGKITPVGDIKDKIKEDPIRAMRYARMVSRYGDSKNTSEDDKNAIRNAVELLKKVDPKIVMDEFLRGLNYEDIDTRNYLKTYKDLGLNKVIFPNMDVESDMPKELRELGDKHAHLAWMLRNQDPNMLKVSLGGHWKPEDVKKITFLIKSLHLNNDIDPDALNDLTHGYNSSGISSRKFKQWAMKLGNKPEGLVNAFIQHTNNPRVQEIGENKRILEWQNFQEIRKMML